MGGKGVYKYNLVGESSISEYLKEKQVIDFFSLSYDSNVMAKEKSWCWEKGKMWRGTFVVSA